MNHLWSPWRMSYIQNNRNDVECVFCDALTKPDNAENLVLARGQFSYVIMNRFPYTSGHCMVVPYEHVKDLEALNTETRSEIMELVAVCIQALKDSFHPHGFNIGANIGSAGGAGIPQHIHIHVIPRWAGDTNFMTSVGSTRVVPESLEASYEKLKKCFRLLQSEKEQQSNQTPNQPRSNTDDPS